MMRNRVSLMFALFMVAGDAMAVLAAYVVAYVLRVQVSNEPTHQIVSAHEFLWLLLLLLPFIIVMFSLIGTYRSAPQGKLATIGRIFFGAGGAMLFMIMIHYFIKQPLFPSKLVPIYGFIFSIIFLSLERGTLYLVRYIRRRRLIGLIDVVLIGDNKVALDLAENIRRDRNYKIQAIVGNSKAATHKTWRGAMRNFNPDLIIQIATRENSEIDPEILQFAQENYIDFKFVPREVNDLPDRIELELFMGDLPMMSVQPTALIGWGRVAKRTLDVVVSGLFLIVFSWLYVIIFLLEKIFSRGGSVIFHQDRLTRGDQKFRLYKFRSQFPKYDGTTPEQAFEMMGRSELIKEYRDGGDFLANDPRVTRIGKFLRKTSLDELPQIWNVFKGDISLVGPRALIPEELDQFKQKHTVLNVKSGITGLAQIAGRRDLSWEQRRKLDIYYVQNWSFGLDIQILFKTAWQVLTGRGAK
ncbi:exopolysaccharide biosynthesis polyprenyl glycosylphosphotransferase [Candidatus Saccharibacteria bacterium]|nr:exopolysaccharide biosynthesis polyprenyl glycosylphosphotransferase [Candidatus Saccharibacteria bacterium]